MITKKQQEKIKDILMQNKLANKMPSTIIELAKELGTFRQNIYLAFQNKCPKTESLLKNWLQSQNRRYKYKCLLVLNESNRHSIKNFGFEQEEDIICTKSKNIGTKFKYNWIIDNKNILKLKISDDNNKDYFIDDLGFISDLLKKYVIKKK